MNPGTTGDNRIRRHLTAIGAASLCQFKAAYFDRRVQSRCRARGAADLDTYADVLDRDPDEVTRLRSAIALGVTSFFRNPGAWRALAALIPAECKVPSAECRAWSAACATGEEAWSLALLFDRLATEGRIGPWLVDATDLDPRNLAVGRLAEYPARCWIDIEAVVPGAAAVGPGGRFVVPSGLRATVRFSETDLTRPGSRGLYDLVLCRNVLMYFDSDAQRQVMDVVLAALRPGGLLMLGQAELASYELMPRLELVDRRERIYRRKE